ncbi:MAG: hypothetical protein COA78_38255 [Blastopirellula sp.]|nr:MAG: hypothetical protein COA78_38255 [Blastopirellula sp.]
MGGAKHPPDSGICCDNVASVTVVFLKRSLCFQSSCTCEVGKILALVAETEAFNARFWSHAEIFRIVLWPEKETEMTEAKFDPQQLASTRRNLALRAEVNDDYVELAKKTVHQIMSIKVLANGLLEHDRAFILNSAELTRHPTDFLEFAAAAEQLEERMEPLVKSVAYETHPGVMVLWASLRDQDRRPIVKIYNEITGEVGHNVVAYLMRGHMEAMRKDLPCEMKLSKAARDLFGGKKTAGRLPLLNNLAWLVFGDLIEVVRGEVIPEELDENGSPLRRGDQLFIRFTEKGIDWFVEARDWARRFAFAFQDASAEHRKNIALVDKAISKTTRRTSIFGSTILALSLTLPFAGTESAASELTQNVSSSTVVEATWNPSKPIMGDFAVAVNYATDWRAEPATVNWQVEPVGIYRTAKFDTYNVAKPVLQTWGVKSNPDDLLIGKEKWIDIAGPAKQIGDGVALIMASGVGEVGIYGATGWPSSKIINVAYGG